MRSVLFVCTANVCRSPMAMGLLRLKVSEEKDEWHIQSAGIWAENGHPPAQHTQWILKDRGIDISDYRSRQFTIEMLSESNLILTMEQGQKEALKAAFPEFSARISLLSEMVGKTHDIMDPVGRSLIDFEHLAQEIDQILSQGYEHICRLAEGYDTDSLE